MDSAEMNKLTISISLFAFSYASSIIAIDFDKVIEKGKTAKSTNISVSGDGRKAAAQAAESISQFRNDDEERHTVQKYPWRKINFTEVSSGFYQNTIDCGFSYSVIVSIDQNDQGSYFYNGHMYNDLSDAVRTACSK